MYLFLNLGIFKWKAIDAFRGAAESSKGNPNVVLIQWASAGAKGFGGLININSLFVLLLAARHFMRWLRETPLNMFVPFDKTMPHFHMATGNLFCIGVVGHVAFHIAGYCILPWTSGFYGRTSLFVSGCFLTIMIAVFRVMAMKKFRSKKYEWFYICHLSVAFVYYVVIVGVHGNHLGKPSTWKFVVAPIVIYAVDHLVRWKSESKCDLVVSRSCAMAVGPDVLCLKLPRVFPYTAGQYADINVPSISKHEWHPFTIASAPHESEITFYIKCGGDWTRKLYITFTDEEAEQEARDLEGQPIEDIVIHIRGPYGSPAQHVGQFSHIICVGGGVGSTPFTSVVKSVHHYITKWFPDMFGAGKSQDLSKEQILVRNRSMLESNDMRRSQGPGPYVPHSDRASFETRVASENSAPGNITAAGIDDSDYGRDGSGPSLSVAMPPAKFDDDDDEGLIPDLGDPDAPIPTRIESGHNGSQASLSRHLSTPRHDIVREANSTNSLFSDTDDLIAPNPPSRNGYESDMVEYDQPMAKGLGMEHMTEHEMQDVIMQENGRLSNMQKLMGLSFGSSAMMRHIQRQDDERKRAQRSSFVDMRKSMDYDSLAGQPVGTIVLFYLHSVTLNILMLWTVLSRIVVAALGGLWTEVELKGKGVGPYDHLGLTIADLVLATLLVVPIVLSVFLEIAEQGSLFFASKGNLSDLLLLLPLAAGTFVLDVLAIAGVASGVSIAMPAITIFAFWPILFVLVTARVVRIIGSRVALAASFKSTHMQTKSLDFIWTAPTQKDDTWVVRELLPLADSGMVRLHRYITREQKKLEKWMLDYERIPLQTHYKRPNWDELLTGIVERSKSGTVIGIFFCGPHPMAKAIQAAAVRAMGKSIKNGIIRGYKPALHDNMDDEDFIAPAEVPGRSNSKVKFIRNISRNLSKKKSKMISKRKDSAAFGCNIKFCFREENFL